MFWMFFVKLKHSNGAELQTIVKKVESGEFFNENVYVRDNKKCYSIFI